MCTFIFMYTTLSIIFGFTLLVTLMMEEVLGYKFIREYPFVEKIHPFLENRAKMDIQCVLLFSFLYSIPIINAILLCLMLMPLKKKASNDPD